MQAKYTLIKQEDFQWSQAKVTNTSLYYIIMTAMPSWHNPSKTEQLLNY
jgi:hypothetical protein